MPFYSAYARRREGKRISSAGFAVALDPYDTANSLSLKETVTIPINGPGQISQQLYVGALEHFFLAQLVRPLEVLQREKYVLLNGKVRIKDMLPGELVR